MTDNVVQFEFEKVLREVVSRGVTIAVEQAATRMPPEANDETQNQVSATAISFVLRDDTKLAKIATSAWLAEMHRRGLTG
jgi:hypothetical protein